MTFFQLASLAQQNAQQSVLYEHQDNDALDLSTGLGRTPRTGR
jgi:hypothetical protein